MRVTGLGFATGADDAPFGGVFPGKEPAGKAAGEFEDVAHVHMVAELHAFDHAAIADVETGNDAFR